MLHILWETQLHFGKIFLDLLSQDDGEICKKTTSECSTEICQCFVCRNHQPAIEDNYQ